MVTNNKMFDHNSPLSAVSGRRSSLVFKSKMSAPMIATVVRSVKGAASVNGIHTDIVCNNYDDKLFIVITQLQKLGNLVYVTKDVVSTETRGEPTYTTSVLFGRDEPVVHVIARQLAANVSTQKPVLFALALQETSPASLRELCSLLVQHKCW